MPKCNLTQDFYLEIINKKTNNLVRYFDKDIHNFILEHRPSGEIVWLYRYKIYNEKYKFYRLSEKKRVDAVEARKLAYIAEMMVNSGKDPKTGGELSTKRSIEFKVFVERSYLPFTKFRKRSWQHDVFMLHKYIYPHLGSCNVHEITHYQLEKWQKTLNENGLSFSSCNRIMALVRVIFSTLVRFGIIDRVCNPCEKVRSFRTPPARERFLTQKEASMVLKYLDQSSLEKGAAFIKLLLFTGARKSEILKARWQDINFSKKMLVIPVSKSGKTRHIALSYEAISVLKNIPKTHPKWVFPNKNGVGAMACPYYLWEKVKRDCNLTGVRLHDLRHSYASFMVNNGCSLYEVQKVLGHSDPKMTQRYAHLEASTILNAVNKTSRFISKSK